ncbi:MAG: globin domain-containing protein [Pseudomonadota bacterium]
MVEVKDPDNNARVRATWALAVADKDRTARVFYSNLFRLDGTTKPLFQGDMELQGRKLMQTLSFIVDHLEDMDVLVPAARDLAINHVGYGVTADQYGSVGTALIETLRQLLGSSFSREDERAWADTYGTLADVMIGAAYST